MIYLLDKIIWIVMLKMMGFVAKNKVKIIKANNIRQKINAGKNDQAGNVSVKEYLSIQHKTK